MQDLKNNVLAVQSIHPQLVAATVTGIKADLLGYESAMAIVNAGAWTDGTHTPSLLESDDDSTYTTVAAGDLQGSFTAIAASGQQNQAFQVGYKGSKRYLKVKVTVTGSPSTGAYIAAAIVKGNPRNAPAT